MPTFDVQAALNNGVTQDQINTYLAAHPELQASSSSDSSPAPVATQPAQGNPTAAPGVGSIGDIGELVGAPLGFQDAHLSQAEDEQRGQLALSTQKLIEAASKQSDPVRRARLLQVAHDNMNYMSDIAASADTIRQQGMNATPNINVPLGGTVSAPTSVGQAAGTALKTLSLAAPEMSGAAGLGTFSSGAVMGGLYGAGDQLESTGSRTTPGQLAGSTAGNAAAFGTIGKLGDWIISPILKTATGNNIMKIGSDMLDQGKQRIQQFISQVGQKFGDDIDAVATANPGKAVGMTTSELQEIHPKQ